MRITLFALFLIIITACSSDQKTAEDVPINSSGTPTTGTQSETASSEGEVTSEGEPTQTGNTPPNENSTNTDSSTSEASTLVDSAASQVQQLGQQYGLQPPVSPHEWSTPSVDTLPVYNFPTDLPLSQQSEFLHSALRVNGLSPRKLKQQND